MHQNQERGGRRGRKERRKAPKPLRKKEITGAEGDAVVFITGAGNAALHGHRSYTASNQHDITTHSSTPPTVSFPPSGLSLPPNLTVGHGAPHLERVGQCLVSGH